MTLRYGNDEVVITVADDGAAAAGDGDGLGHGLIGMRERAELFGGTVTAGPRPGRGFQVRVTLPAAQAGQPRTEAA